jgi:hypothetical protein
MKQTSNALPQDMLCNTLFLGARASGPRLKQVRRLRSQENAQELLWRCTRIFVTPKNPRVNKSVHNTQHPRSSPLHCGVVLATQGAERCA